MVTFSPFWPQSLYVKKTSKYPNFEVVETSSSAKENIPVKTAQNIFWAIFEILI